MVQREHIIGLYKPDQAKESCGFGLIAHQHGETSHELVSTACIALTRMTHRGAIAVDGKTGDGCGLLMQLPQSFFRQVAKEEGVRSEQISQLANAGAQEVSGVFSRPSEAPPRLLP